MIELWVKRLEFSDGTELALAAGSVVAIVGPNNSGKSEAIRNLSQSVARQVDGPVVVVVEYHKSGDKAAFEKWLEDNAMEIERADGTVMVSRVGTQQKKVILISEWGSGPPFQHVAQVMSITAMAEARLSLVKPVPSYPTRSEHPSNALQHLYSDPQAELQLSDAIKEAFGTGVVVDRTGGSQIYLLYGDQPLTEATLPPSAEYLAEINALRQVDEQGDGVKSFTGLTMAVGTGVYPLVLVDEPEAFLHPPQAKLLGRRLAASAGDRTQVFLATHSADLLQGLIEEKPEAVNVVRVTRAGAINPTAVLSSDELKILWEDPLLRYSNVLDGLFHDRVVICEADADCRFYGATFDQMDPAPGERKQEVLFTHVGGKARIHTIVRALRAVAVPISVVADIDILRSPEDVKRVVEALGADWKDFEDVVTSVKAVVDSLPSETLVENLVREFHSVFDAKDPKSKALPEDVKTARAKLKVVDGWARLKSAGVAGMPNGQPTADLVGLLEALATVSLHVVPVGELEGFNTAIGNHGPQWVAAALEAGSHRTDTARRFVHAVMSSAV
jgi:hypothetical protein